MPLADKGSRIGNFIIDSFCFGFVYILFVVIVGSMTDLNSKSASFVVDGSFVVIYFIYYFAFEYFLGKTPGKYLTHTKVVYCYGGKLSLRRHLIRSISRLISIDIFSFLFGQGFHDTISGSCVVKE